MSTKMLGLLLTRQVSARLEGMAFPRKTEHFAKFRKVFSPQTSPRKTPSFGTFAHWLGQLLPLSLELLLPADLDPLPLGRFLSIWGSRARGLEGQSCPQPTSDSYTLPRLQRVTRYVCVCVSCYSHTIVRQYLLTYRCRGHLEHG